MLNQKLVHFSFAFLSFFICLGVLSTMNVFGSGPDDASTVRLLEDVEHQSANRTNLSTGSDEIEPNNSYQQATTMTNAMLAASISSVGDVDYFSFSANAGDRLFMALESASSSSSSSGSSDSLLEIFDRDGTSLLERDDDDGSFSLLSSSIAGLPIPASGTYYARVKHASNNRLISPYYVHAKLQSGSPSAEVEPNNTTANAQALPAAGWVAGTIDSASDADLYSLDLNAGDSLYIALDMDPERDGVTWNGRAGLGLLSNTFVVANDGSSTSPNSEAFFLTIKESGTYFVYVDASSGAGAHATYHLSVDVQPKASMAATCTTYRSSDVPLVLGPNNSSQTTANLIVPYASVMSDLNLGLQLTHDSLSDLQVTLKAPNGLEATLLASPTSSQFDHINIGLDDEAWLPAGAAEVWEGVVYQPSSLGRLSSFDGTNPQGTWSLTFTDSEDNNALLSAFEFELCYQPMPAITFKKTVGTSAGECATTDEITVSSGSTVYYCDTVENRGTITFTSHSLVDDQLGTLFNQAMSLAPGERYSVTTMHTIEQTTINNATWSATDGTNSTSASASAKVSVSAAPVPQPSIELQLTVGTEPETCASSTSLSVLSGTPLYYCYQVSNNGTVIFTEHDLFDNEFGKIFNDELITLEPGQSYQLIREVVLTESTTNQASWTAYGNQNQSAEYLASAEVTILTPALSFSKTVGTQAGTCATTDTITVTTGSQVHYCYRLHNSGDVPLISHRLLDDQLGTLLISDSLHIAPAESYSLTHSTILTQSVVNQATWSSEITPTLTLTHTDIATVTVLTPIIDMSPHTMQSSQNLNQVITHTMMISNSGNMALEWTLIEENSPTTGACNSSDIPWLELTRPSGSTPAGSAEEIIIDFDTAFIQPNLYSATLCIQNNDPTHPQMRLPLTLTVLAVPTALEIAHLSANESTYWPWAWLTIGGMLLLMACGGWCLSGWRRSRRVNEQIQRR